MDVLTAEEIHSRKDAGTCFIKQGEYVNVEEVTVIDLHDCKFESGSGLVFYYAEESPAPPKKHKAVRSKPVSEVEPVSDLPVIPDLNLDAGVTSAVVGMADQHLADFSAVPKDPTGLGVVMAVVAVAGGGTAWKFYNDHSKRKHEQEMARIEKSENSHKACTAVQATLEAKVASLEAALNDVRTRNQELQLKASNGPDVNELVERLEALEQLSKKKGKK